MTYSGSVTSLLDTWAAERVSGGRIDWAEIDNLVALLTHRFPPQEEAARDAGGTLSTTGIPAAYLVAENGLDGLPQPLPDTLELEEATYGRYGHQNAVTALDHVVTDRATAGEIPVVILGQWTNAAELATGLGFATLDQPITNGGGGRGGKNLPLDGISRVLNLRRAFEEFKAVAVVRDEIAAPQGAQWLGSFWNRLVMDEGDGSGSSAEEVGHDMLCTRG